MASADKTKLVLVFLAVLFSVLIDWKQLYSSISNRTRNMNSNKKKCAIALSGLTRWHRQTHHSLQKFIIEHNSQNWDFHIFIDAFDEGQDENEIIQLYKPAKHRWTKYSNTSYYAHQVWRIAGAFHLSEQYQQEHGITFDLILRMRFDLLILEPFPIDFYHGKLTYNSILANVSLNNDTRDNATAMEIMQDQLKTQKFSFKFSPSWGDQFRFDGFYAVDRTAAKHLIDLYQIPADILMVPPEAMHLTVFVAYNMTAPPESCPGLIHPYILLHHFYQPFGSEPLRNVTCHDALRNCYDNDVAKFGRGLGGCYVNVTNFPCW